VNFFKVVFSYKRRGGVGDGEGRGERRRMEEEDKIDENKWKTNNKKKRKDGRLIPNIRERILEEGRRPHRRTRMD